MRIGEFAKACKTKISVLRHYDKLGLLCPVYIDKFTDYRYYDDSQIVLFNQIKNLQNAGFSLADIKLMLTKDNGETDISSYIVKKRDELSDAFQRLESVQKIMLGESFMNTNTISLFNDDIMWVKFKVCFPLDDEQKNKLNNTIIQIEEILIAMRDKGYRVLNEYCEKIDNDIFKSIVHLLNQQEFSLNLMPYFLKRKIENLDGMDFIE